MRVTCSTALNATPYSVAIKERWKTSKADGGSHKCCWPLFSWNRCQLYLLAHNGDRYPPSESVEDQCRLSRLPKWLSLFRARDCPLRASQVACTRRDQPGGPCDLSCHLEPWLQPQKSPLRSLMGSNSRIMADINYNFLWCFSMNELIRMNGRIIDLFVSVRRPFRQISSTFSSLFFDLFFDLSFHSFLLFVPFWSA